MGDGWNAFMPVHILHADAPSHSLLNVKQFQQLQVILLPPLLVTQHLECGHDFLRGRHMRRFMRACRRTLC